MNATTDSNAPLQRGMKVIARDNIRLGVGEVFSVELAPILHYKVLFPAPPVKTLYPHEALHFSIPSDALVQTKYGTGKIVKRHGTSQDGLFTYDIEFFKDKTTRVLQENVITRVSRGIVGGSDLACMLPVDGTLVGLFLNAYYFRYCLPSDPRFQAVCHGRIEAFPHQIKVINQVLGTYPSRFLLCDEVGLGKTIEACAILKELTLQNVVNRAIIVVPANLVAQWRFELDSKFNLDFEVYDGARVKSLKSGYPGINPWTLHPRILTSLHFLRRDEHREALKDVLFDMAIFDEAHHLRRYAGSGESGIYRKTKNYDLGEIICNHARIVLLLTATPMQLNPFELFSLIQLLDPSLFPKYSHFMDFKDKIAHYNLVINNLDRFGKLNIFESKYTSNMIGELLAGSKEFPGPESIHDALVHRSPALKEAIIQAVRDRHLLSRILIRNKKRNVFQGFLPKRITKIVLIEPTKEELEIYKAIRLYITRVYQRSIEEKNLATGFVMVVFQRLLASSHVALRKTIQQRVATLRELQVKLLKQRAEVEATGATMDEAEYKKKMATLASRISAIDEDVPLLNDYHAKLTALKTDSKATALVHLIQDLARAEKNPKAIVFTQFIRTLHYLKRVLETTVKDVVVGIFHGKLTKEEKDLQIDQFRSSTGKPFVLISTEAGGEGRNFQFCHVVVNYDLPWNPMKLEQRIGRVDRIGQDRDVRIFNFALKDTVEEQIVSILSERIYAFQEIVGELEPILVNVEDDITEAILSASSDDEIDLKFQLLGNKLGDKLKHLQDHRTSMQDVIMELESKEILSDAALACNIELNYYNALKEFTLVTMGMIRGIDSMGIPAAARESLAEISAAKGISRVTFSELKESVFSLDEGLAGEHVGTFNRVQALKNERLEFFNIGHAFIEKLIDITISIDTTKYIGVLEDTREHVATAWNDKRFKVLRDAASAVIVCNAVDMTGVKSQRHLECEVFAIARGNGKNVAKALGRIPASTVTEYLVMRGAGRCDEVDLSTTLPSTEMLSGIMEINNKRVAEFVEAAREDWKHKNDEFYKRMREREEHFHAYRVKKYQDEILQYKFMIGEKTSPDEETVDSKVVKVLESRIVKSEGHLKREQEIHAKNMQEIDESYRRVDVSTAPLAILVIRFRDAGEAPALVHHET
ncbi:MAG: DEAD/DEAH box helicase family protein [Candidatus Lokiarchaeota archaeon]|nr:DEAD/DEAH box helicase family protein [Candidatus Lokiarchaeota archaeon]